MKVINRTTKFELMTELTIGMDAEGEAAGDDPPGGGEGPVSSR